MANNNNIYKMSNAGGFKSLTRYWDMLAGNTTWSPWEPQGAYDALATVTVPSGGITTIEFVGIPSDYKHLQLRGIMRMSSNLDGPTMRFNGDTTTSNYREHYLQGNGTSASSGTIANDYYNPTTSPSAANTFAAFVSDVLDYNSSTKYKTLRTLEGFDANGSGYLTFTSGLWMSTSAITSIKMTGTTMQQYSQVSLYGVK